VAWEHFPHEADIGIRGRGATLSEAFREAARALVAVIADPEAIGAHEAVAIECDAEENDVLLFDWLNALVYEMATRRLLFSRFEVAVEGGRLRATAWGEPVDTVRHAPAVEVKGATWTALRVDQDADGLWTAECVVDV
jgi:SHS2 domain-containing protein